MEAIAKTRHLKGSPRKARLVIDLIRGRNVSQALNILKFTDKRAAEPIEKTLRSAIANATYLAEQQNIAIDPDDLFVKTCFVDMGAHKNRRRMRPAPQGRAFREQRHYCHITILVSSDKSAEVTKSAKKSMQTSGEKGDGGMKTKDAPKVKDPNKAKAEKPAVANTIEEKTSVAETSVVIEEKPILSDPIAEMMDTKQAPEVEKVEMPESQTETSVPKIEVLKAGEAELKAAEEKPKSEDSEANDILDVDSPEKAAREKVEGQKSEVANAKNVHSQTPASLNETKKADNAQLDENDILELQ